MIKKICFFGLGVLVAWNVTGDNAFNQLSPEEKETGFELIFNGSDFQGWSQKGNWVIENGVLTRQGRGGSLTYQAAKVPDDFELRFEWKVASRSNSGIYYRLGPVPRRFIFVWHPAMMPPNPSENGTPVASFARGR